MTDTLEAHGVLFEPFQIGTVTLRNRIFQTPLSVCYADRDGSVNGQMVEHYGRRAAGGSAMIITENLAVSDAGRQLPRQALITGREHLPGLARLAGEIKRHGAVAVAQIVHAGRYAGPWDQYEARPRMAPSAVPFPLLPGRVVTPHEMTGDEVEEAIADFARAAALAEEAGFDGIEIHGAQGFLISSFQSPRMNLRTDGYGQDPNRLACEVTTAVRGRVSSDFLVGYHLFADELMPGGWTVDDALAFAGRLPSLGIDFVMPMVSTFESLRVPANAGLFGRIGFQHDAAVRIARSCDVPVLTNGQLGDPDLAARVIASGESPMVGLGRPLLADPDWPAKVRDGRAGEVRRCPCDPPRCLQTQLSGVVCDAWPPAARDAGVLGYAETELGCSR